MIFLPEFDIYETGLPKFQLSLDIIIKVIIQEPVIIWAIST